VPSDTIRLTDLLAEASINFSARATDRDDAVRQAGGALVAAGAVDQTYVEAMLEREKTVSTFVGEGVAIPHGTLAVTSSIRKNALVFLRFPTGVDWDGNDVRIVIGMAASGGGHIALLSQVATVLMKPLKAQALRDATEISTIYELFAPDDDEGEENPLTNEP